MSDLGSKEDIERSPRRHHIRAGYFASGETNVGFGPIWSGRDERPRAWRRLLNSAQSEPLHNTGAPGVDLAKLQDHDINLPLFRYS
jgi:hypothetical protein